MITTQTNIGRYRVVTKISGVQAEPALQDLLFQLKRDLSLSINCCQIGTIQSYNAAKNSAKVSINFKRQMNTGEVLNYPVLDDCPVFILSGGSSFVSCPIASGDECLVLFNDRNLDNWWVTGQSSVPADSRAHSIADGIVLVGVNSLGNAVLTPSNSLCINGGSKKISIKNNSKTFLTILNALIDALTAGQTANCVNGAPVNTFGITGSASQLALAQVKTDIAALFDLGAT